jgi:hypothetical protein
MSLVFGAISIIQLFVDWDVFGIKNEDVKTKVTILCIIIAVCFVIAFLWATFFSNSKLLYSCDDVKITAKYGDLMKIAFPKKQSKEKIIVIAVNRCFDTVVDKNIIKAETMHGQFLKKIAPNDIQRQVLDFEIEKSLKEFGYNYEVISKNEKKYGKRNRYPLGSVARIGGENGVTFFLMALTTFDTNCVAKCDKHQYVECLLKLFEFYNAHGQGQDLYLYAIGSGMARTGFTKKESLDATIALTKIMKHNLKSLTTVIVDKRDKNELSIMDLS